MGATEIRQGDQAGEVIDHAAQLWAGSDPEYSRVGTDETGKPIYRSSLPNEWSYREKQNYLLYLVTDVWAKKPLTLYIEKDGTKQKITARFDPTVEDRSDATKIAYGNRRGTMRDQKTTDRICMKSPKSRTTCIQTTKPERIIPRTKE